MKRLVSGRIEPARGFDQAEVAFVDQIEQRHAQMAKTLRILHDDAQICLDETRECVFITVLLDAAAKLALVIRCQRGKV